MRGFGSVMGLTICVVLMAMLSWSYVQVQMIADITEDVETEFGIYHPYLVDVDPCVQPYVIEPDFSNVVNMDQFDFSGEDSSLLLNNGFVVKPTPYKQLFDIYTECADLRIPAFVTTDAVLHTYHVLYDYMLRILEMQEFFADLVHLSQAMMVRAESTCGSTSDPGVREAARRNVAYFAVGNVLLDSTHAVPGYVDSLVRGELALMEAHQGYEPSPLFFYPEDYSQYVPRGHYTRNDTLRAYFMAMMWYGRLSFAVEDLGTDIVRLQTTQALLITQALNALEIDGRPASEVWARIYDPTVFFVGKTDDLNVYQYTSIAEQIYGSNFANLPADSFGNETLLDEFVTEAAELPDPLITTPTPKGFRLVGQRFIPDSYMFDRLVIPFTGRSMPRGLDITYILGSDRAYEILDDVYHETVDPSYVSQLGSLRAEFDSLPDARWAQNLYWNWLYSLMPLLFVKGVGYPPFMQNPAWLDKELATSLGSWVELRHDTILYAKQSISEGLPWTWFVKGYVEPNPNLYARLAALARFMITGFEGRGLLLDEFMAKLETLESLLLTLKDISIKELINQDLAHQEYDLICRFGEIIEGIITFPEGAIWPVDETDDDMAVIADVHTDPFAGLCLEEGVGYPLFLYVIVSIEDTIKVTKGGIFSYYEFVQPMSNRLTDEAWQEIQTSDTLKSLPIWMASFVDTAQSFLNYHPWHYCFYDYSGTPSEGPPAQVPRVFSLLQNYPNPFNPLTTISYIVPGQDSALPHVSLRIYNLLGEVVRTVVNGMQRSGYHEVRWDGRDDRGKPASSGVYFYRLEVEGRAQSRKMVLIG